MPTAADDQPGIYGSRSWEKPSVCRSVLYAVNILVLGLLGLFQLSCRQDVPGDLSSHQVPCDTISTSYAQDILPILNNNCNLSGCHAPGSPFPNFTAYDTFKVYVDNGNVDFWIFNTDLMPPLTAPDSTKLTRCEKAKLRHWLDNGALNN